MFHPGDTIGPYTLLRTLGRGAFGEVWLADRASSLLTTQVALKLPLDSVAGLDVIRQEAKVWLRASGHPNIVPVLEAEVYNGQVVIASEYVAGGTLHDWMQAHQGKAPSTEEAITITNGILAGLDYLHCVGLTHRDLKPENVLLQYGIPRLTDFGLAHEPKTDTHTETLSGTPHYMAPETFSGSYAASSDLWAVGVLLYELLTGVSPFPTQETMALIAAIQNQEPVPLPESIPERLRNVVLRLLAKSPSERFTSASAVREAMQNALQSALSPPIRSEDRPALPRHNLPLQPTSFIGREQQIAELRGLLKRTPLLTLTGSGGCGKTRLSLQVAEEVLAQFADGVWLVELASLTDPALVPNTIADVLGIKEIPAEPITKTLLAALNEKQLLLILDNCEHVLEATAHLVDTILRSCPKVRVLASSREALGIAGESAYRVPSLSLPQVKQRQSAESVSQYEAVRLFIERAMAAKSDFVVTDVNAPVLCAVCQRLDGIPLAIELAAARVRSLTVEEIHGRLDHCFPLLTGGSRTALPRQRSLRTLIEWSYDLLSDQEKTLFCRLAVFAGGWTLQAAEQVCVGETIAAWEIFDLLTLLVDKSLVISHSQEQNTRYHFLETVRQYAWDRLQESGDLERVRKQHQAFFVAFATEAEPNLRGRDQAVWLHRMETEHDNVRATLEWRSDEASLRIVGAIWPFWAVRGHVSEGRMRIEKALEGTDAQAPTALRAKALVGAGGLTWHQSDFVAACALYEEALAIQRELGNKRGIISALGMLGSARYSQGDYCVARILYHEALELGRELGEKHCISNCLHFFGNMAWMEGDASIARKLYNESLAIRRELGDSRAIAYTLDGLGGIARLAGEFDAARALHNEALAIQQEVGYRGGSTNSLNGLASIATLEGDYKSARALHSEALTIQQELGDRGGIATSLDGFAILANKQGQSRRAAMLWGAAAGLREKIAFPLPPPERALYDRQIKEARTALEEEAFASAWAEGQAMMMEQAIEYALDESAR